MPAKVSVVIPVYNGASTLGECIGSILNQDMPDFEMILVDDGSVDESRSIMKSFKKQDSRVHYFTTEHRGIVPALNLGLSESTGQFIARMDSDDTMPHNRLSLQRDHLQHNPEVDLVSGTVEFKGDRSASKGYARYVDWINSLTRHQEISINRFVESPLAHPSVMFRKSTVEEHGAYKAGPFPEDYEMWLRWLERGVRMEKIDHTVLNWSDYPDRLSRNHERYSFQSFYALKAPYLARWLSKYNPYHPNITLWGSGRTTRKRAAMLETYGINIEAFVDIDPNKIGKFIHGKPVLGEDDIKEDDSRFIVSYVALRGAQERITRVLIERGFTLGRDYIFAA